jgi:hypothetical protein
MALVPFVKVEGLGNDFLVVDLRVGKPAHALADVVIRPATVRALCDRNFGVGGDGVLAILPGERGDARMRVLNADGSEAEMCGNGLRCVAKVLFDRDPDLRRDVLRIDTGAGLLVCKIDVQGRQGKHCHGRYGRTTTCARADPGGKQRGSIGARSPTRLGPAVCFHTGLHGQPARSHLLRGSNREAARARGDLRTGHRKGRALPPAHQRGVRTGAQDQSRPARDRPGGLGARLWHHPGLRHWRLRNSGRSLPRRAGARRTGRSRCTCQAVRCFITAQSAASDKDGQNFASIAMRGPAHIVFEAAIDPSAIELPGIETGGR